MKDDGAPIEPADEEELRSAAALARALDGGSAGPDLPQAALETAALLRLSAGIPTLRDERRAEIRRELLESLPPVSKQRRRYALPRWLMLGLPLAGTAALGVLVLARDPEPAGFVPSPRADRSGFAEPPGAASPVLLEGSGAVGSAGESARAATARALPGAGDDDAAAWRGPMAQAPRDEASAKGELARRSFAPSIEGESSERRSSERESSERGADLRALGGTGEAAAVASRASKSASGASPRAPAAADALAANRGRGAGSDARRARVELDQAVLERRAELLARVNDARLAGAHAEVDAAAQPASLERSQHTLVRTLETLGDGLDPTDARLVRQDLFCRLAQTALRLGQPRAALEWTRRGLELDGPPTPFLAQLMALEGDAWAALGEDASAASSYMRALRVQETMLDESLDGH